MQASSHAIAEICPRGPGRGCGEDGAPCDGVGAVYSNPGDDDRDCPPELRGALRKRQALARTWELPSADL